MITITDINGSRNFLLSQIVKKIAIYVILFFILSFAAGMLYIKYLNSRVDRLSTVKSELIKENENLNQKISASKMEFEAIEGKISDLEEQFGLSSDGDTKLVERILNVTMTSAQERVIFSQIPNGKVLKNIEVSANFGWRNHPILNRKEFHPGVDLRAPIGTPIYAPADGVVQFYGNGPTGFGYLLELRHNFGFATRYAHLSNKQVLKAGDFVKKGDLVAYSGNSGMSTGPHLHYEVRFIQRPLDPMNFINWNSKNYNEIFEKEKGIQWQSLIEVSTTQTDKQQ